MEKSENCAWVIVESLSEGGVRHREFELPEGSSNRDISLFLRDKLRAIIWEEGVFPRLIEDDPNYKGWLRIEFNIEISGGNDEPEVV